MEYFIRGDTLQVWKIDGQTAMRLGVTNPEQGAGTYYAAAPGETIWQAIQRMTPWFLPDGKNPFVRTTLGPGEYYPRIARPLEMTFTQKGLGWYLAAEDEASVVALSKGQLVTLVRQLDRICQCIHPSKANFAVYGHDIRNLLILACTEVENHWRGVLTANAVKEKGYFKTTDYVKLVGPMRLNEYAVSFPAYPWLDPIKPFATWGKSGKPTRDLIWYNAYNAVKHDREGKFARATLERVFEAVTACAIMIAAQFGQQAYMHNVPELDAFFYFEEVPKWELGEIYINSYSEVAEPWAPVNFPF